jgi:hypothetical protein
VTQRAGERGEVAAAAAAAAAAARVQRNDAGLVADRRVREGSQNGPCPRRVGCGSPARAGRPRGPGDRLADGRARCDMCLSPTAVLVSVHTWTPAAATS